MTMVYLANVPSHATYDLNDNVVGITFYAPHQGVMVRYPRRGIPDYVVDTLYGRMTRHRFFQSFADAMDYTSRLLKQTETV